MTRRMVATLTFVALTGGGVLAVAAPAHAHGADSNVICIGGDNQRKPGYVQAICLKDVEVGHGG